MPTKRKKELDELLSRLNLTIDNYDYLDQSLIHGSYTFEHKLPPSLDNQRLICTFKQRMDTFANACPFFADIVIISHKPLAAIPALRLLHHGISI